MVQSLTPQPEDYVVLTPKHSAFYATPLDTILTYIGARNAIVAGSTTNTCVMMTVADLYVRAYKLFVPEDCVRALNDRYRRAALQLIKKSYAANTSASSRLRLYRVSDYRAPGLGTTIAPLILMNSRFQWLLTRIWGLLTSGVVIFVINLGYDSACYRKIIGRLRCLLSVSPYRSWGCEDS